MGTTFTSWDNFLQHDGQKGMRWGIRRWQNEDGSLTPEGKEHYRAMYNKGNSTRDITNSARGGIDAVASLTKRIRGNSRPADPEIKQLSDNELRQRINRLQMEKQYSDLTAKDTKSGFETAKDILSFVGSAAAVIATGVGLYTSLKGFNVKGNEKIEDGNKGDDKN